MNDKNEDQGEKTLAERAQEVGRDGAYLEVDAQDLLQAYQSGELQKAKIVVVKASRSELSNPADVDNLIQAVGQLSEELVSDKPNDAIAGMSKEQASVWLFREILLQGLVSLTSKKDC